jgi:PAS domain S-box-containing protein
LAETPPGPGHDAAFDLQTLRLAMRAARIGTWVRDLVTEEVHWSRELEAVFGLEPGTFARSRSAFHARVHPEDVDRLRETVDRAIEQHTDYACEFRFRHADGGWRWMDGRGRAEYDASGRPLRLHGVGIDITARRQAEEALRASELRLQRIADEREQLLSSERAARSEAERLSHVKDEFLATLSHELRTPLNAIQGWAALLRRPGLSDADRERGLATIERNTRAQARIIDDLLDMSRIVSGKIHLDVQTIELHDVIAAAVEAVAPTAQARRIQIGTLLDTTLGPTRGDPNRLQQVVWNLLTNAVKFTPPGGRVEVVLHRVDSHAEIAVRDTGQGIRPEFLPHVFDRFRQADASTTRTHGGLGLGLSIVRNLVELHGGSVRAESEGEGRGSTFIVSLPLPVLTPGAREEHADAASAAGPALFEPESGEMPLLAGARVVVVDDEHDTRELLVRILESRGAVVRGASSAPEALDLVFAGAADLLVSDIGMPGMDGYQLMRRLRERERERQARPLPAIAVTAYARDEDRQRSLVAGYQMHIAKPVDPRELLVAISNLLRVSAPASTGADFGG